MSNQQPLEAVTISAVRSGDSLLVNHTSSNGQGRYRLTGLPLNKPFEVLITRKGYQDTFAVFTLTPEKPLLDSLDWLIRVQPIKLRGVSVLAKRAPFTYRYRPPLRRRPFREQVRGELRLGTALKAGNINSQLPPDMGRRMQRLNARVERRFLPKEKLTLSLTVNDIFNNRQDVMRRVTSSYVENRTGNSAGRFFLLKFQYNFDMLHEKRSDF